MLPSGYQLPVAIFLVLSGTLACFAGYRLFRLVLGIYGFIFGAAVASSVVGATSTAGMLLAALIGGLIGAAVLMFAYFVGIALIGAGIGALVAHIVWTELQTGDPPVLLIAIVSIVGAIGAMLLQRYVIIVGSAFGGAWTLLYGGLLGSGSQTVEPTMTNSDVWILYPLSPAFASVWNWVAWIAMGLVGAAVQLSLTAKRK